jgi:hypothetical protein
MPYKEWGRERLLSSELQDYLQDQVVLQFPTASARRTAVPEPKVGMLSWLDVPGVFEYFTARRQWEPLGALRVDSPANLPAVGSLGMEAIEPSGQRWEWRVVQGKGQWTWPREPQGVLSRQTFAPTANVVLNNAVHLMSALATPAVAIPAGRHLRVSLDGALASTAAGTGYGLLLEFAGQERRAIVHMPVATWPVPVHCEFHLEFLEPRTQLVFELAGGRIYGTGDVSMIGKSSTDGPLQLVVEDVGAYDLAPTRY